MCVYRPDVIDASSHGCVVVVAVVVPDVVGDASVKQSACTGWVVGWQLGDSLMLLVSLVVQYVWLCLQSPTLAWLAANNSLIIHSDLKSVNDRGGPS